MTDVFAELSKIRRFTGPVVVKFVFVIAELPINTSPFSTCKLACNTTGDGPITAFPYTNTFIVVTAFDTTKFAKG
jgi:hypothetical protein